MTGFDHLDALRGEQEQEIESRRGDGGNLAAAPLRDNETVRVPEEKAKNATQQLHLLIDQLSPEAIHAISAVAHVIRHAELEYDDEELSEEGKRMLAEGRHSLATESLTEHEDFRRELGL
ncbi:MAG: hypothetical protein M3Z85_13765 [Acidobacteriota bacterium]|nr:hypothetical protein [Acidobacteriota bacterium]